MEAPEWDDGSYAPLFIRLAFNASATYHAVECNGGSNGATMRFEGEAKDPENAGLEHARKFLESFKQNYPSVSFSDLWVLAAYAAIEHAGGPRIEFRPGRVDVLDENEADPVAPGRLPVAEKDILQGEFDESDQHRMKNWEQLASNLRNDVFGRMGFGDQEIVALICGGHSLGRCHAELSGYSGSWVPNPTLFSNAYAVQLARDRWYPVTHDSKMPDGLEVPEEVRPRKGRWQYVDLSRYRVNIDDELTTLSAPEAEDFRAGQYVCMSDWVNVRATPDLSSAIIGRIARGVEVNLIQIKIVGTTVRARADRGGWVSIQTRSDKTIFKRLGKVNFASLVGQWRATGVPYVFSHHSEWKPATPGYGSMSVLPVSKKFYVSELALATDERDSFLGRCSEGWVLLHSPTSGTHAELIVPGYNEKPRQAVKGQTDQTMMLVSDMVLLWDAGFRLHVERYASNVEALRNDFGKAFKRLTEFGCPWSKDYNKPALSSCPLCVR
eukprot:TRINITY_DN16951_c0_g2_i1.p1 TRINITY_DN16951_c0_g2~~TRINITY_DN16951_c0_g2_i1.p1  ORF type:complete len:555 (-),score=71.33 TRINITY_DN16951_c0_g2_i1:120-1607(-)